MPQASGAPLGPLKSIRLPCAFARHNFDESTAGSFIGLGFSTLVKLCAGAVRRYHCTTGGGSGRRARGRQPNQPTLADISWTPWWTQARVVFWRTLTAR